MRLTFPAIMLIVTVLSLPAGASPRERFPDALPSGANVIVTQEADLTGDGLNEVIVGYTLPRKGPPPTEGRSAVLERTPAGGFRRFDLEGAWGGHYLPRFTVRDLTGDGRPELIRQVAGGGAWEMLSVFQWAPGAGYTALLHDPGQSHLIWDTNGDGLPEVLGAGKIDFPHHRQTKSFRWLGDRHIAWHTASWYYGGGSPGSAKAPVADLVGLTVSNAVGRANRPLGMIVPVDSSAPAGQVVAQLPRPGAIDGEDPRVHLAVSAGSTQFAGGHFPGVWHAIYRPKEIHDELGVPAGSTPAQRGRWAEWLTIILRGARQVVHARSFSGPAYIYRLLDPWTVFAGGRSLSVRWIGVPLEPPYKGLVFLGEDGPERSPLLPRFATAIFSAEPVTPPAVAQPRPLKQYLHTHPDLEAFVTLAPESWKEALRLRGIRAERWPDPDPKPALQGNAIAVSPYAPVPDHAMVTVLNGYVKQARRQGEHVWIDLESVPGKVHRWPLPLIGFPMGMTPYVHILGPNPVEMALHTPIPISQWHGPPPN